MTTAEDLARALHHEAPGVKVSHESATMDVVMEYQTGVRVNEARLGLDRGTARDTVSMMLANIRRSAVRDLGLQADIDQQVKAAVHDAVHGAREAAARAAARAVEDVVARIKDTLELGGLHKLAADGIASEVKHTLRDVVADEFTRPTAPAPDPVAAVKQDPNVDPRFRLAMPFAAPDTYAFEGFDGADVPKDEVRPDLFETMGLPPVPDVPTVQRITDPLRPFPRIVNGKVEGYDPTSERGNGS